MNYTLKKQLHNRKHRTRQFLATEMRLSKYYEKELDTTAAMLPEEYTYISRVVLAVERTRAYMKNEPDAGAKLKFMTMMLSGNNNVTAVCDILNISRSTYFNWRASILRVFGSFMGIFS